MTAYQLGDGMHGVIEVRPSGFGPDLYVGEVRDRDDQPIRERVYLRGSQAHWHCPVTVGSTEAAVLRALRDRAMRLSGNDMSEIPAV